MLDGTSSPFLNSIHQTIISISPPLSPYIPFSIFGIIHAIRITMIHRSITKVLGIDSKIGLIQSAAFPVILIFSGSTITSILLSSTPSWVISPMGLANYAIIPLIVAKSPILPFLQSLPPLPLSIFFSFFDGFSRTIGATSMGVDSVLSNSNPAIRSSPWAMILIALIAGGGGGMIVPMFNISQLDWGFKATPNFIKDGPGIDIWGAGLIGYVYATLIDAHPFFRLLPCILFAGIPEFNLLPKGYENSIESIPLLPPHEAKMFCSILLGSMLVIKLFLPQLNSIFFENKVKKIVPISNIIEGKVIKKQKSFAQIKKTQ